MNSQQEIELPQIDDYRSLFLNDVAMLDVRAPVEYQQGAFPHTDNQPLMNDQEREEIGIRYKELGQDEAIKLGHALVQGEIKEQRVQGWEDFFQQHPEGVLYCFRGGMRSKITQQWIYEKTGIIYPRVMGGYKAMRRFLIDELETSIAEIEPIILSGRTGIGKTIFLKKIQQQIDLEGIYHHRGSVFGKHATPQPSQIDIENTLSIALMKQRAQGHRKLVLEDESSNIGSRKLPQSLIEKMKQSAVVVLDGSLEYRIDITFQEYIIEALAEFQAMYGAAEGFERWAAQLHESFDRIQKRLGGVRYQLLKKLLGDALQQHRAGNMDGHKQWIEVLLVEYYDPMYDYQLSKKMERVVFRGTQAEVMDYLQSQQQIT